MRCSNEGPFAIVSGTAVFLLEFLADGIFHCHHELYPALNVSGLALPDNKKLSLFPDRKETLSVWNQHLVREELTNGIDLIFKKMFQNDCSIAFAGSVCTMNPKGAPLVLVLIFHRVTDFFYGSLHIFMDNVLLPHIGMARFGINIHH